MSESGGDSGRDAGAEQAEQQQLSLRETLKLLGGASRGYWAVNLVNFGDGICYFGILNLLVLYLQRDVGMATQGAHAAVSTFTGVVTVGMFLGGGFVSDWLGVRRALNLSLLLVLIGRVALVAAPSIGASAVVLAWLAMLVMGVGEAVIQPALYAGVKEYADKRTATMGYALIYAIMNLGIIAESAVSPLIRAYWRRAQGGGDDAAGGIVGVYGFLVGVTVLMLLTNLVVFSRRVEQTQRFVPDEPPSAATSLRERLKQMPLLDVRFIFFIFILLPVRTLFAHHWLTVPDYVIRCFSEGVGQKYEWISALNPLIIVIFVPLIAATTRHVSVVKMMIIGTFITALSTALVVAPPNLALLLSYIIIFSFGEAVWSSRFLEYVAELAPPGKVGAYMGIATLPWFLAKATTGWYSGAMLDHFIPKTGPQSPQTLWMIYGLIAIVSPIGLVLGRRWVEARVPKTSTPTGR